MARTFVKILTAAIAVGALISLGAQTASAKGGGGGHGHGGKHVSGAAHVRGAHSRVGRAHIGRVKAAHIGRANVRGVKSARVGTSRSKIAHMSGKNARALGAAGALGGRAAWNRWGNPHWRNGWNGGWGGWSGPVFWPYFFGNLLAFTFWPYGYYAPFWGYGDTFVWDAIFWPGPYYAYGPAYYDVYGGYAYGGRARTRVARHGGPETTGSTPNRTDLAQTCGGLAPGVTDLPIDRIEATIRLTDEQFKALDALKTASSQASDVLRSSCSSEVPQTPLGRLDAAQKRIDGMMQALAIVRTPLDNFNNSLNDDQRQRFAALGAAPAGRTNRRGFGSDNDLAALCSRRAEGFTQLPAQRVEQVVRPTQQQLDAFDRLKTASTEAANQLQASCPTQMPQTPLDRFDAVAKRLTAMAVAMKTVRPALASFYDSLDDEQKARFNTLGPPAAAASRQG
jgi:LTXXQ motif family protein